LFDWTSIHRVFFERKFDFSADSANTVNSILYIVSAFASPIFGFVVDRAGRNIFWVFLSILVTIAAHGMLAFTFLNPYIAMITMGLAYSMLASALWPVSTRFVFYYSVPAIPFKKNFVL